MNKLSLGARNPCEAEIFAVEGFRVHVQHQIQKLLNARQVSYVELATRLGVSESVIFEDIFGDECKIDIRMLAKIFHALDSEITLQVNKHV